MRKVSVLSLAGVAAVGLMVSTAQGATLYGTEIPDLSLGLGQEAKDVFNLDDFFDSTGTGAVTYTVTGGSVSNGKATVFGSQTAGKNAATFKATSGSESVELSSSVYVSASAIQNGPDIDDNNRIAGQDAGNLFLVGLAPGSSASSSQNLVLPAGGGITGGGATNGGATGAAALITTIASLDLVDAGGNTGLRVRNHVVEAEGTNSASVANELTATLNSDGSYRLEAGANIDGDYIVTFGARAGAVLDAVHLVAAEATDVNLSAQAGFATIAAGAAGATAAFGANGVTVTAGPGQGLLVVSTTPVAVSDVATIQAEVTNVAGAVTAVVGFDAASAAGINPNAIAYTNPSGANVQAGVKKNVATIIRPTSGNVLPAFQVFNSNTSGNINVTISKLSVLQAGALTDYALNPNAKADLSVEGSVSGTTGWLSDIKQQQAAAPTLDTTNHFANGASAGSLKLAGTTATNQFKIAQVFTQVTAGPGTVTGEAYVRRVGAAGTGGNFILILTDGAANEFAAFIDATTIPTDSWRLVQVSSTLSAQAGLFFVAQAANADVLVDDFAVRVIDDEEGQFDEDLLGL